MTWIEQKTPLSHANLAHETLCQAMSTIDEVRNKLVQNGVSQEVANEVLKIAAQGEIESLETLQAALQPSEFEITSSLIRTWEKEGRDFLETYQDQTTLAQFETACSELDPQLPISARSIEGIESEDQRAYINNVHVKDTHAESFIGGLRALPKDLNRFLSHLEGDPRGIELVSQAILQRAANFIEARKQETGIIICSTFKPEIGHPFPSSGWHGDDRFLAENTRDGVPGRKKISVIKGIGTEWYPDDKVDREAFKSYCEKSALYFSETVELERKKIEGNFDARDSARLQALELQKIQATEEFEATIHPDYIQQMKEGESFVILSGDPEYAAVHRVPAIVDDRIFLQVHACSYQEAVTHWWKDQVQRVANAIDLAAVRSIFSSREGFL